VEADRLLSTVKERRIKVNQYIWLKWLMSSPYDESFGRTRVRFLVGKILGHVLLNSQPNYGLPGSPSPKNQRVNTRKKMKDKSEIKFSSYQN
jgi:hypothetical protein